MKLLGIAVFATGLLIGGCEDSRTDLGASEVMQIDNSLPRPRNQEEVATSIVQRQDETRAADTILARLTESFEDRPQFLKVLEELAADAEPGSMAPYRVGKLPSVGDELSAQDKKKIMMLLEQFVRDYPKRRYYLHLGYYATFSARLVEQDAVPFLQRLTRDYLRSWRANVRLQAGEDFGLIIAQRIALGDTENAVKDWAQVLDFSDESVEVRHLRPAWEFPDDPIVQAMVAEKLRVVEENGISYNASRRFIPLVFASEEAQPLFQSKAVRDYLIRQLNKTDRSGTLSYVAPKGKLTSKDLTSADLKYKFRLFTGSLKLVGLNAPLDEKSRTISLADITLQEVSPGFTKNNPINEPEFRKDELRLNAIKRLERGEVFELPPNFYPHMAIYRPQR